jgi:hypothetical protein
MAPSTNSERSIFTSHRRLLHVVRRCARASLTWAENFLLPLTGRLREIRHGEEGTRYARSLLLDDSFIRLILSSSERNSARCLHSAAVCWFASRAISRAPSKSNRVTERIRIDTCRGSRHLTLRDRLRVWELKVRWAYERVTAERFELRIGVLSEKLA